jgi:hypothetical protein
MISREMDKFPYRRMKGYGAWDKMSIEGENFLGQRRPRGL